jgi:hypothetical protein
MVLEGSYLLRHLVEEHWVRVVAYKRLKASQYYPFVVFHTPKMSIVINGEAHMSEPGCDVFSLKIAEFDSGKWESELKIASSSSGSRLDVAATGANRSIEILYKGPRCVRFFTSSDFIDPMLHTRESVLMRCVAVEFFVEGAPDARLLVAEEGSAVSLAIGQDCEDHIRDYYSVYHPPGF